MKYELHVPVEQYGFVAATLDTGDVNQVRTAYERIKEEFSKPINVLGDKEFTDFIYNSLNKAGNSEEVFSQLSSQQQRFIKQLGNALNRKPPNNTPM